MDSNAVRIAAVNTLVALKEQGTDMTARQWNPHTIPLLATKTDLVADAVWTLMLIPALLDEHTERSDQDALYRLGGAHTVLWHTCTLTPTKIEEINRLAVEEAKNARSSELH